MENDNISLVNGTYSYSRTDKIRILTIVIEQMKAMITENERQIDLGDDVNGRERMINILTAEKGFKTDRMSALIAEQESRENS